MRKVWVVLAVLSCLALAIDLCAQGGSLRGRIFLPNGEPLAEVIPVTLTSEDARFVPQILYTDSKGWFFLQGLLANQRYSIVVESDGKSWATTTESFFAGRTVFITVNLRSLETAETVSRSSTVSVQQLQYKPRPEAKRAYQEGLKAYSEKNVDLARQKFRQAVELDPGYVRAYNDLAAVEMDEKRYADAEPWLRAALDKDPDAPLSLLNLGIVLDHLGRYQEAVLALRKTLQLRPQWISPKVYLGIALVETNELAEAERFLLRGVRATGRQEALAFLYLGKLYAAKGEREKAVSAWESYLARDPDSPNATEVRSALALLRAPVQQP